MRLWRALLITVFCVPAWCGDPQYISDTRSREVARNLNGYDGNWWAAADHYERDGFFWGAADCQKWDAHVPVSYDTSDEAFEAITRYYDAHRGSRALPVVEVWKRVAAQVPIPKPLKGGEVWNNPHGFLNGFWYQQGAESRRFGFLEGYIGCLRTYIKGSVESYAKPIQYYDDNIWGYTKAHPKAEDEAIADILRRFREKPKAN
jgi:hypothetical protein